MKSEKQKGQAAILIIFVLGMVAILIGLSLAQTGFRESLMGHKEAGSGKAFYVANSGVEEGFYQIGQDADYGVGTPATFDLLVGDGKAQATVYGTTEEKTIESVGTEGVYVRKLKVIAKNTSVKPEFENAIQAGQGGFELRNNTRITGKGGTSGNVYSNTFVKAAKNDCTKKSSSIINGSVWAVDKIDKLADTDSGPCIIKDAYSDSLNYCFVKGVSHSPNLPSVNCPSSNPWMNAPKPESLPLPDMELDFLKNYLAKKGKIFSGDCILDGSGGPADCSGGTNVIGEMVITGNLEKKSNLNIKISGPVWVQENITLDSLGSVNLTPEIKDISQIIFSDGVIVSSSNVSFGSNGNAFLLFISTFKPLSGDLCDAPAISISSNNNSVLFYATQGCVEVNANGTFHGAILGEKIRVINNSTIEYDPALQMAIFGLTKSGGWQTISFQEE